tara:strand:+ start:484 stop:1215 length:732 start_codon:yes stop_codon:yes gene_type:complete
MSQNKKVFITGASGGIGSSVCKKFQNNNFTLILTSSSDEKLSSLKDDYGKNHYYYKMDLSDESSIKDCTSQISKDHKDLSVIVNNGGMTQDNLILRMNSDQWSKVIKTNLDSSFHIIKSLLPNMITNRYGKIIGISSVVATTGNPGQTNYVASKSGMIGLYKSIAHEVAKRNINVNIVSPGFITSDMTNKLSDNQKDDILMKIPMKKFGDPTDVANLVYFLSTDDSSYITGQNFNINGGMLMF